MRGQKLKAKTLLAGKCTWRVHTFRAYFQVVQNLSDFLYIQILLP